MLSDTFKKIDRGTLTPDMQKLYDEMEEANTSMNADYTAKTTALAEQRKLYEGYDDESTATKAKLAELSAANKELKDVNTKWGDFFDTNFKQPDGNDDDGKKVVDNPLGGEGVERDQLDKVEKLLTDLNQKMDTNKNEVDNKMGFTLQLVELARTKGDKFDMQKIIDTATTHGLSDLSEAYDILYKDDILNDRAQKIADEKMKEYIDAQKGSDPSGGSAPEVFMPPPTSWRPDKSYSIATKKSLQDQLDLELSK